MALPAGGTLRFVGQRRTALPGIPGAYAEFQNGLRNFFDVHRAPAAPGPATRRSRPGTRRRGTCAASARALMKTNDAVSEWLRTPPRMLETWVRVPAR